METDIFVIAVGILMLFAVYDLIVGVSNDAVNFLNSSIGSRVAPRNVIMAIASVGIIAGVSFSGGMMEVARKGIFNPQFFTMPTLITIFLAVMIADIIILDLFNTLGLPTSTTVSIVFELLGAAVAVSIVVILRKGDSLAEIVGYINTAKAMLIIFGILLSVVVAFILGAICQFLSRILFTFDYTRTIKRYGPAWSSLALASIVYFILIKGSKGATFISAETYFWIKGNTALIIVATFFASYVILQLLSSIFKVNVFRVVILAGTFSLAMAFASNDLVNFIGVPLAGFHSYKVAMASPDPLNVSMESLAGKVSTETFLLLIAGGIMVVTLWISRKSRTVSQTELGLATQEEGIETFESSMASRAVVRTVDAALNGVKSLVPLSIRERIDKRMDANECRLDDKEGAQPFDLVRASVNLMVAAAVISFATSQKLPLSTTYVTFMVAMGTSFSDRAWGRETAVYRVAGVMTVITGWFMTALSAFTAAFIFAGIISYLGAFGVGGLMVLGALVLVKNHKEHGKRSKEIEDMKIFNLKKITDARGSRLETFKHIATLISEMRESLSKTMEALFSENVTILGEQRRRTKQIQTWTNIITANVFKVLRLQQKEGTNERKYEYGRVARRLQNLAECHRDLVMKSWTHVSNNHAPLLPEQVSELRIILDELREILEQVESVFERGSLEFDLASLDGKIDRLRTRQEELNLSQENRIPDERSKTRLSILYFAIVGSSLLIAKHLRQLIRIFEASFKERKED